MTDPFEAALRAAGCHEGKTYHDSWAMPDIGVIYTTTPLFSLLRALYEAGREQGRREAIQDINRAISCAPIAPQSPSVVRPTSQ